MTGIVQAFRNCALALVLAAGAAACATFHDVEILYRLPPSSDALQGTRVGLAVEDARGAASVLGPGAAAEFRNYPGDIVFSVADPGAGAVRMGRYKALPMVDEAFRKRVERTGVSVSRGRLPGGPDLVVVLRELSLDLVDRRWVSRVRFQVRLTKNGRLLATQDVSGEAERYHLMGFREANQTVSEMFTDAVNRFDLEDLFRQAEKADPGVMKR